MQKEPFYKKVSSKFQYRDMSNFNPFKPLVIWANANTMLDDYYDKPDVNLGHSDFDNEIRNTMRHTVGLGITGREYGNLAYPIGSIKEGFDVQKGILLPYKMPNILLDTIKDTINNHKGIQYMRKYPYNNEEDLMDYAYGIAQQEQEKKYKNRKNPLFKLLITN